jgi:hypothetical protein
MRKRERDSMPDDTLMRIFGSATVGSIEWVAVFSFIAFALVYFLAPVAGYQAQKRGLLLASLYLLVGYGLLALLQITILYLVYLAGPRGSGSGTMNFVTIVTIVKLMVFLAAQGMFVLGLQGLKRGSPT